MNRLKLSLLSIGLCLLVAPAWASEYNQTLEALNQINKIKPDQNPAYESADDILKGRVLDQRNKVVGQVRDVVVKSNGSIAQLEVNFDRLRLGSSVYINYRDLNTRPANNGYIVGFRDDQIRTLYPTFLSNIETASGASDESMSVRKMLGSQVISENGRKIGTIDDVFFAADGGRVEAVYVSMQINNLRGRNVAIPLAMVTPQDTMLGRRFVIGDNQADAMIDYADNH